MNSLYLSNMPHEPHSATKFVVDLLFNKIWPLIKKVRLKLQATEDGRNVELVQKAGDVFTICCSQLNKCIINLFQIFKFENRQKLIIDESRKCTMERLSWCMDRLNTINQMLESDQYDPEESLLATPMYFVNWIDHTFEILTKLSDVVYRTDYQNTEELFELWKNEIVEIVGDLHLSLDELLLSAMTLCRFCLPSDQLVVRARCQVVLREGKLLLTELISEDLDSAYNVTQSSLKLPIMPSNMSVLIDVLKDALYVLETNTNTALLTLLVHCFSKDCPVEKLRDHLSSAVDCVCRTGDVEDCQLVQDFDLHNERLMQIGNFAVSCSSDQNRISVLLSGLASLEALDPALVPALALSPRGPHAALAAASWRSEVREVRDSVFLIVDPVAFAEKCKQMMHEQLLPIISDEFYDEQAACSFTSTGGVVLEFFNVYKEQEPDALLHREKLLPIIADLSKAYTEVKIVMNMLSANKQLFNIKMPKTIKEEATLPKLKKRLKLLYTLVSRINDLYHPKEIEDQFFEICEPKNATRVVVKNPNIGATYVQSPKKEPNGSRTFFARTSHVRTPSSKLVLNKLTQHLNSKRNAGLSFSVKIDEMFDLTDGKENRNPVVNKLLNRVQEKSILYHSPKKNKSLRKALLSRHCKAPVVPKPGSSDDRLMEKFVDSIDENDFLDATTSLQITEILDQMNDMSNILHCTQSQGINSTCKVPCRPEKNILKIDINKPTNFKKVWNIPVNCSPVEIDESRTSDASDSSRRRSDVTTQERLNDLDLVENRLTQLKLFQHDQETSL